MKKTLTVLLILIAWPYFGAKVWSSRNEIFPNDEKGFEKALTNYNRGFDYYERGPRYFEQSLKYLLEANDFNPNNSDLNYAIGSIYNTLNLKGEAADYYKKRPAQSQVPQRRPTPHGRKPANGHAMGPRHFGIPRVPGNP